MNFKLLSLTAFAALVLTACGGGGAKPAESAATAAAPVEATRSTTGAVVDTATRDQYREALEAFDAHDKAADWNDAACNAVASKFADASDGGKLAEGTFNAGLAQQRCGNEAKAKEYFDKALSADPNLHHARVQSALYKYKADNNINAAIDALQKAVLDAKFQNVPALVYLAMLQMRRDEASSSEPAYNGTKQCNTDMECARKNLTRALAIDDAYMPASNQLGLYYLQNARKAAGYGKAGAATGGKRINAQQLELAALVCAQAIRKNASYAPIHNTAGLVMMELGQMNGAVQEFGAAARLDPKLYEAQMNLAAVNLGFRGFDQAEAAYKRVVAMRPDDFEAHLGLALALRGQISDANYDAQVAAVQAELDSAKKLGPTRPEPLYNEGILVQEFKSKGLDQAKQIAVLEQAKGIYQQFLAKTESRSDLEAARKKSKDRIQDIDDTIQFLKMGDAAPEPAAAAPSPTAPPVPAAPAATK